MFHIDNLAGVELFDDDIQPMNHVATMGALGDVRAEVEFELLTHLSLLSEVCVARLRTGSQYSSDVSGAFLAGSSCMVRRPGSIPGQSKCR